mgnify:CR=1 FL=1
MDKYTIEIRFQTEVDCNIFSGLIASSMAGYFVQKLALKGLAEDRGNYVNPVVEIYNIPSFERILGVCMLYVGMRANVISNFPLDQTLAKVKIAWKETLVHFGFRDYPPTDARNLIFLMSQPNNFDMRIVERFESLPVNIPSEIQIPENLLTFSRRLGSLNTTTQNTNLPSNNQELQQKLNREDRSLDQNQQNNGSQDSSSIPIILGILGFSAILGGYLLMKDNSSKKPTLQ